MGLSLLLVGFAPQIIAKTPLKDWVVGKLLKDMQAKYSVGEVSLSWFGPAEIHDLRLHVNNDQPALDVPRATTEKTLLQLVMNTRDVGTITLHEPTLWVLTEGKTTNVEQAIAKYLEDDGSPAKPERFAIDLKVVNGTLKLSEAKTPYEQTQHTFQLGLNMPKSRTESIRLTLDLDGRAKPGTLKLDAQFAPANTLGVNATAFDLSQLAPILLRFSTGTTAKGTLTSALTLQWGGKGTSLNGKADVAALELAGPWLGSDRLALDSVSVDSEVTEEAGVMKAKKLNVVCDVGQASFSGEVDPSADTQAMLARTGITLDAKVDLAKLAAKIPAVLRIREGVEIREGTITAQLRSHPGEHGPAWKGAMVTSHLAGSSKGKPIEWKDALDIRFDLSFKPGRVPFFEQFEVRADFLRLAAKGELEHFVSAAEIDLRKLTNHLDDFVDLGYTFDGTATVTLNNLRDAASGGSKIDGSAKLLNFAMVDAMGVGLREKQLDIVLKAAGTKFENGYRLDNAAATVTSEGDRLELALPAAIPDVRKLAGGEFALELQGDFAKWVARIGPMVDWPPAWKVAGTGTMTAKVKMEESKFACEAFALAMKDARFHGTGLDVNEPTLNVAAKGSYDRKTRAIILNDVNVTCQTVGASAKRMEMRPASNGQYGLAGDVNLQAQVGRLMRTLGMATEMDGLAQGKATFDAGTPGQVAFDADLKVENFRYGPAAKPTWSEPWITLKTQGKLSGDDVTITSTKLARDGFAAEGQGKLDDLAGHTNVAVNGTLTYDLAKLEPQLKAYLGKTGQATGTGTKPFQLSGNLSNGGQNLAVNVGSDLPGSTKRDPLAGNAALEWQSLKAYGFDVGQAELKADLRDNAVKMSPVEATFGGGRIRVEPTLQLNKDYDLSFKQGTIIQKAKLTPAACSEAIGYALPLLANVADASGTVSFDLAENRIPLTDPGMGTLAGTLTIHDAEVSPNELIAQVAGLFTQKTLKIKLAQENKVPIRMDKGRVYHENLAITLDGVTIRSSGSVGVFDGGLDLVIQVPLQGKLAEAMVPADRPVIREAVARQTLTIAVKGTMGKPLADREAFRAEMGKVIQKATRDAAAGAADDLIKKGLEGLFPKK
jgi:hypothetical protein